MPKWFGPLCAGVVIVAAIIGMLFAFSYNASPYVTVEQAKTFSGNNLHLAGDLIRSSVVVEPRHSRMRFDMTDANGDEIRVIYSGAPPANMGDATKIVAVGELREDAFYAHRLLVKCPSKYEGEQGDQVASAGT